ncbi:MAG: peptidoglycan D,D-transpeptidase FtsI family protein [Candidatus Berkiella sp.]
MTKFFTNKESFLNSKSAMFEGRSWRLILICAVFLLFTTLIVCRLIQLHISHTAFLQAQGNARTLRIVDIPSYRGMITDRRGTPLAISSPVHAAWVNPQHFSPDEKQLENLSALLGMSAQSINEKITQHPNRVFAYLKRGIPPDVAQKIKDLNIAGLGLKREFRRYYPTGMQSAQLIGFTDIDDHGQSGLELTFEEQLKPIIGKKRVLEDRTGRHVQDIEQLQTPHSGQDIALSIDVRIQGFAYRELENAVERFGAKSATLVMLDVQTGEVIAMVTAPSFNPNNRQERHGSATRNRALTDLIEPGSTIKAFSIASALESRLFTPETLIDTNPGIYYVANRPVKDVRNYGLLTLKEVLVKSSNIGISKITLAVPPEQLINTFRKLGFGDSTKTPFPGERRGMLPAPPRNPFMHATIAFGYGLSVTPLQIVHAYATLATMGEMRPISLVKVNDPTSIRGEQVLPADVAKSTLNMLTEVISSKGTGSRANIPGYKTAGKTGTTRVVGPQGYDPHRHIGLFAGITPVDNPRLATIVVVEEPNEAHYYGGLVAAPIYKNVVSKALHILNVPPDNTEIAKN